jgi:hypothetical protein
MKQQTQLQVLRYGAAMLLLLACGATFGVATGCSSSTEDAADGGDAGADADAGDASSDAATDGGKDASADAAAEAGDSTATPVVTGIPECDDLLAAYGRCLDRKPELKKNEAVLYNVRKTSLRIQSTTDSKESVANRCKMLFERPYKTNCMM